MVRIWIWQFTDGTIAVSNQALVIFYIAVTFGVMSVCLILALYLLRIIKPVRQTKRDRLRLQFQNVLNKIIINEGYSTEDRPNPVFEFYLAELRLVATSSFARQQLLDQILDVKKSVTGNSAAALVRTCHSMSLYEVSYRKLRSCRWQKKALAIRELAEMGHRPASERIARSLYSRHAILQQESLMGLVRLEEKPLSFLGGYKGQISPWMRLNIHRYLQRLELSRLPLFSDYFTHPNVSVILFSISMVRAFNQRPSLPALAELLYHCNPRVVGLAVTALGEMEAFQYREVIAKVALHAWRFEKLAKRGVRSLGRIGQGKEDIELLGRFLNHPSYAVRFEATGALKKLGAEGEAFLHKFNNDHGKTIDGILRHFAEPLLT